MSKIAMGLGSAMGIWGVGMGTTAISNGFGGSKLKEMTFNPKIVKLTAAKNVKEKYMELPCIGGLFKEIEWKETQKPVEDSSFGNEEIEGCIAVWWEKEAYDSEFWKGSWNLVWGMKGNVSGMIFSSNVKAKDGKITEDTLFYTLQLKQEKWTALSDVSFQETEIKRGGVNNMVSPNKKLIDDDNGWDFDFYSQSVCSNQNSCVSESPKRTFAHLNWNFIHENKQGESGTTYAYSWIENIDRLVFLGTNIKKYLSQVMGYFELVSSTEI